MKRFISLLLALCIVAALPVLAMAEEKVTLKVLVLPNILTANVTELPYLQEMAEKANVNIEWESITTDYTEVHSVMMASGELPDVLLGAGAATTSDFAQFSYLFADMNELLDYAPNVTKMFEEKPEIKAMVTSTNGAIYGLSKYQRYWPKNMCMQMINKDWLDRLNLEVPTTWDELYNVLVAFRDQDANGNGDPTDEIPMDWAPGISGFNVTSMVSTYGLPISMYQGIGYYCDDGVAGNFFASNAYKELIIFLNKCYTEGLINPDVFTQDYTSFQNLARSGVVGFTFGYDILDRMGAELEGQYVSVAPLKPSADYTGEVLWENDNSMMNYAYPMVSISSQSAHKEEAMRFVDLFFDPYYSMQTLFGSVGTCIQDNGDGTYAVLPPADSSVDPGTWKWMNALADNSPMYISDSLELTLPTDLQKVKELDSVYDEYHAKYTEKDVWPGPFLKLEADAQVELSNINVDLDNLFRTNFATWISVGGVETDWDAYLANLKTAGLDQALQIYQTALDAYFAE